MNEVRVERYVSYFYDGSFSYESKLIKERDLVRQVTDMPKEAFAFSYYDITIRRPIGQNLEVRSGKQNESGVYFINGKVINYSEIERMYNEHTHTRQTSNFVISVYENIIRMMHRYNCSDIILCHSYVLPFYPGDTNIEII